MSAASGWIGLVFGAVCLLFAAVAFFPCPVGGDLPLYWDGMALMGNELTLHTLGIVVAGLGLFVGLGALGHPAGRIGAAAGLLACALLTASLYRAQHDGGVVKQALEKALPAGFEARISPERAALLRKEVAFGDWSRPLTFSVDGLEIVRDLSYGPHGAFNTLDLIRGPAVRDGHLRPVLLHLHGGGLMFGKKGAEALPLLYHLARNGWIVVTIEYRLSPAAKWPAHIEDAKRAVGWIRQHIHEWGGDPGFVATTGGSAGGYLASLLALTPNKPQWQPGFEATDTSVQASVPYYTGYDFRGAKLPHLGLYVMPRSEAEDPALWADASPIVHVGPYAPPFFVINGTLDALVPLEWSRAFVQALAPVSRSPVVYAELDASHGFDAQHSLRVEHVVAAVQHFLEWAYAEHRARRQSAAKAAEGAPA